MTNATSILTDLFTEHPNLVDPSGILCDRGIILEAIAKLPEMRGAEIAYSFSLIFCSFGWAVTPHAHLLNMAHAATVTALIIPSRAVFVVMPLLSTPHA